jgi:hypothetical protein
MLQGQPLMVQRASGRAVMRVGAPQALRVPEQVIGEPPAVNGQLFEDRLHARVLDVLRREPKGPGFVPAHLDQVVQQRSLIAISHNSLLVIRGTPTTEEYAWERELSSRAVRGGLRCSIPKGPRAKIVIPHTGLWLRPRRIRVEFAENRLKTLGTDFGLGSGVADLFTTALVL